MIASSSEGAGARAEEDDADDAAAGGADRAIGASRDLGAWNDGLGRLFDAIECMTDSKMS
jgi:hypothetical protein